MLSKPCSKTDVILDARMIRHSGIGTYLRGLLGEYPRQNFFKQHSFAATFPPSLTAEVNGAFPSFGFRSPIYSLWEQMEYPVHLAKCRVWHAPHYNVPFLKKGGRLVVTIHDLIHWIFRKEFFSPLQAAYAQFLFQRVVRSADRIITVSEKTREDLIRHFKASPGQIRVIYEGVSEDFFEIPELSYSREVLKKYNLPGRFFLYVGLVKPHKNVKRLLKVFKDLRSQKKLDLDLVLVGKKDRRYPRGFESLAELGTGDGIHYLPGVESRRELASLYASALSLVHPSLYEGFGLTCLEAMASGTPVIVSKAASLPEVVGEAGLYIDPNAEDSLAEALLEMVSNESLRKNSAEKGRQRAQNFRWSKTAQETAAVYQELL